MSKVITRFAPSPTGLLHIGNARTAIINWLYARKFGGEFILRIDDTDTERSSLKYEEAILKDLHWLGLNWDSSFKQSTRLVQYNNVKDKLIASGRLYPCYENVEELEFKRKMQLSSGKPPIYDRAALKLTKEQISSYQEQGRKPHYRFFIEDREVFWLDLIKGEVRYHGRDLGDPVVVREDGTFTYILCSCIDDIDSKITHIIRGEDHVTNTAVQIQIFESLGYQPPKFAHLSLVKGKDEKISKRVGGFEIAELKEYIEPLTIVNFFSFIGSSKSVNPYTDYKSIINEFDISAYSKSPTTYLEEELLRLNHKILLHSTFQEILPRLQELNIDNIDEEFWLAARPNLYNLKDLSILHDIYFKPELKLDDRITKEFITIAINTLPNEEISKETWHKWTNAIANISGKHGKDLYLPLRLALTGRFQGLELSEILPLIGRDEILKRLEFYLK